MAPRNSITRGPPRISSHIAQFSTVLVDAEKVPLIVHQELLTYYSPFFQAALTGRFQEATRYEVILKEVQKDVFEFFVPWLYHKRLPSNDDDPELLTNWTSRGGDGSQMTKNLISLHIFCDKYDVPLLKRLSLDRLFEHLTDRKTLLPADTWTMFAFQNLPDNSPLYRLLVDINCRFADEETWAEIGRPSWEASKGRFEQAVQRTFFKKLLQRYTKYALTDQGDLELCDYHDHGGYEERQTCSAKRMA